MFELIGTEIYFRDNDGTYHEFWLDTIRRNGNYPTTIKITGDPWFEGGIRLSFSPNERLGFFLANGVTSDNRSINMKGYSSDTVNEGGTFRCLFGYFSIVGNFTGNISSADLFPKSKDFKKNLNDCLAREMSISSNTGTWGAGNQPTII